MFFFILSFLIFFMFFIFWRQRYFSFFLQEPRHRTALPEDLPLRRTVLRRTPIRPTALHWIVVCWTDPPGPPQMSLFSFSRRTFRSYLSGGLFVELWPRPKCAFVLLTGHFVRQPQRPHPSSPTLRAPTFFWVLGHFLTFQFSHFLHIFHVFFLCFVFV